MRSYLKKRTKKERRKGGRQEGRGKGSDERRKGGREREGVVNGLGMSLTGRTCIAGP